MISNQPVYCIPIIDKHLIWSPMQKVCAVVNSSARDEISRYMIDGKKPNQTLDELISFLTQPVRFGKPSAYQPLDPLFLGIIPSRRCTMHCSYCDFGCSSEDNQVKLDPQSCLTAIDYYFEHAVQSGKKEIQIQFFGGEPFIEDDIIDITVHYSRIKSRQTGIRVTFEASTNGYYSEERAKFIADYIDIPVLSLDGFKKYHDRNRPVSTVMGSFETVCRTAKIFGQSACKFCIRCCITQESVSEMAEMAQWFCTEFNPSVICFETLQENEFSDSTGLRSPDPLMFSINYRAASRLIGKFGIESVFSSAQWDQPRFTFCPLGRDALICGPDLGIYGCYLEKKRWETVGFDLKLGEINKIKGVIIDQGAVARVREIAWSKPYCENCFCRYSCAGGCHVNTIFHDNDMNIKDFCRQTRLITVFSMLSALEMNDLADELQISPDSLRTIANRRDDIMKPDNFL